MSALTGVEAAGGRHFPDLRVPLMLGAEVVNMAYSRVSRSLPDPNSDRTINGVEAERVWHEDHRDDINPWDPLWPSVKALVRLATSPISWLRELINTPNISDYGN